MMNPSKLSPRETFALVLLVILLLGAGYYMFFYTPLQDDLISLELKSSEYDTAITASMSKIRKMDQMQSELDEILSRPAEEITQIAPYDNKEAVLDQLYTILSRTADYTLNFTDPEIQPDGTVRRNISMRFRCDSYETAKEVIRDLSCSPWRCLISSLSISCGKGDMMAKGVSVNATITFFEHTGLN